jgi:hypothetical protein
LYPWGRGEGNQAETIQYALPRRYYRRYLTFHAEKYVKGLFGIHRVEDAFQRLDKLTQEEVRMAEVEILTIASRIDENIIQVEENLEGISEGVQSVHMIVKGIDGKLEGAQIDAQSAGCEVGLINTGDLITSLAPDCKLSLTRLGVTEVREKMQVVLNDVSDLNRS